MSKFQRTKPHVNSRHTHAPPRHSTLAVALSHAILKDVVDYRIAQEDNAAQEYVGGARTLSVTSDVAENRIEVPVQFQSRELENDFSEWQDCTFEEYVARSGSPQWDTRSSADVSAAIDAGAP